MGEGGFGGKGFRGGKYKESFFHPHPDPLPSREREEYGEVLGRGIWGLERVVRKEDVVGGGIVAICEKMVVKSCEGYKKNSFLPKIKGLQNEAPFLHFLKISYFKFSTFRSKSSGIRTGRLRFRLT